MLRDTIMIALIKAVMAQPAGRLSDVQAWTRVEEDEYGVPAPRARAAELTAADPRLETAGRTVEAVGIEQPVVHPIPTILERFRGQGSMRTRPKNTSKTHYRTFL